jgi:hypothetical protein
VKTTYKEVFLHLSIVIHSYNLFINIYSLLFIRIIYSLTFIHCYSFISFIRWHLFIVIHLYHLFVDIYSLTLSGLFWIDFKFRTWTVGMDLDWAEEIQDWSRGRVVIAPDSRTWGRVPPGCKVSGLWTWKCCLLERNLYSYCDNLRNINDKKYITYILKKYR